MSDSETYYVKRQGRVEGPWTMRKLQSEVGLRKLGRFHEVSEDGENFRRAEEIEGLFTKVARKTPGGGTGEESPERTEQVEKGKPTGDSVWYCCLDEEQVGPMTLAELGDLVSDGQLLLDDLIWREGFPDWMPAEGVPELRAFLETSPAGEPDDETEATRLVQRPSSVPTDRLAVASAVTAGILLIPSCVPLAGLLGLVPATMAIMAIMSLRNTRAAGMRYAVVGLVIGAIEILWGFLSLALSVLGVTTYWSEF